MKLFSELTPLNKEIARGFIAKCDSMERTTQFIAWKLQELMEIELSIEEIERIAAIERNKDKARIQAAATELNKQKVYSTYVAVIQECWDVYQRSLEPTEIKSVVSEKRKYDKLEQDVYDGEKETIRTMPPKPLMVALRTILAASKQVCELLGLNAPAPVEIPQFLQARGIVNFDSSKWMQAYNQFYDKQGNLITDPSKNPKYQSAIENTNGEDLRN